MERRNIKQMTLEELEAFLLSLGVKSYRAKQIWSWIYQRHVTDFASMSDLSKDLRSRLEDLASIGTLAPHSAMSSTTDRSVKFLFHLDDGLQIESVLIPERHRMTVCISTQVGCALKCRFCATGQMGFRRDLASWEIVEQVLAAEEYMANAEQEGMRRISNVVLMGMGEPLLNYDQTLRAVRVINHDHALRIGARKITVSTAGIVPAIDRLAGEGLQVKLAISLNAATDDLRTWLMPINKRHRLSTLIDSAKRFVETTGKRITFEYVLIDGVNDSRADARNLARLVGDIPCKVNLIPYNPHRSTPFQPSSPDRVQAFRQYLLPRCPAVTLRASRGQDIGAACGQLCTDSVKRPRRAGTSRRPAAHRRAAISRPRQKK